MAELLHFPTTKSEAGASHLFGPQERVNDLIPGGDHLDGLALFADEVWDLAGHPAWKDKAGTMTQLDFRGIAERWRTVAKEMMLLQLDPGLAPDRAPKAPMAQSWPRIQELVKPMTAMGNLKALRHALRVIDDHRITAFDEDDWERIDVL